MSNGASKQIIQIGGGGGGTGTVTNVSSTSADITITNPTTIPAITIVSAPKLTTARNINGVAFDGTGNITIADSTKQPIDVGLTSISALTGAGYVKATATDTFSQVATIPNTDITGLGTLSTQNGTFSGTHSGTSSGTNTGDQTSIVGITGTKAQFDTAVTDGNIMYVGDAPTAHTHLLANITDVTMTVANLNSLDDGVNSTLHFHDADRARSAHTGTQASATISDFNSESRAQTEAELVAGTNITITPSGAGATRQLTIASTGGGGGTMTVQDEGITTSTIVTTLNFTGAGVTASGAGATATINIGGGGGSSTKGIAEVDFGAITQETDMAVVTVTDASITTTSYPSATMYGLATADHDPDDYVAEGLSAYITNIVNGVSFDIAVHAENLTWGKYKVTYLY